MSAERLYTLAVTQRYQRKQAVAAGTLTRLLSAHPDYSRGYQEQGHQALAANRLSTAQEAYEQAVRLNPALTASWRALINLYELQLPANPPNIRSRLAYARRQLAEFDALPAPLLGVASFYFDGALARADELCRDYLRSNKTDVDGMRWLARIGEALGVLPDAEFLLATALELAPGRHDLRYDYANLLLKMQQFAAACDETSRLVAAEPASLSFQALHGNALAGLGRYDEAVSVYDAVLDGSSAQPAVQLMRGHALKTRGHYADAVAAYRGAARIKPDYGDAWWSLANTKSYRFDEAELATMVARYEAKETSADDRIHLGFALGKAFEDGGDVGRAADYYIAANALKKASVRHRPEYLAHRTDKLTQFFTAERVSVAGR